MTGANGIIRTERGLAIAGTRITLYQLMDYIHAGYPPKLIRHKFLVTDEQFEAAMSYIEANRAEVETEYQIVLREAEEIRQYWEERNREKFAQIAAMPPKPGYEAAWAKLKKEKAKLESQL
jgi:uncharacterized protein (DUF433 family)